MRSMRQHSVTRLSRGTVAAVAAVAAAVAALSTFAVALIATSLLRVPNADPALDGDPCCPYPNTWGDVLLGAFGVAALAVVALGLLTLAVAMGGVAAAGRQPALLRRHRRIVRVLALASAVCAFALPVVWAVAANA